MGKNKEVSIQPHENAKLLSTNQILFEGNIIFKMSYIITQSIFPSNWFDLGRAQQYHLRSTIAMTEFGIYIATKSSRDLHSEARFHSDSTETPTLIPCLEWYCKYYLFLNTLLFIIKSLLCTIFSTAKVLSPAAVDNHYPITHNSSHNFNSFQLSKLKVSPWPVLIILSIVFLFYYNVRVLYVGCIWCVACCFVSWTRCWIIFFHIRLSPKIQIWIILSLNLMPPRSCDGLSIPTPMCRVLHQLQQWLPTHLISQQLLPKIMALLNTTKRSYGKISV